MKYMKKKNKPLTSEDIAAAPAGFTLKKIDTMETKKCKYNTGGLCQKKSGATFSLVYCDESCIQPAIRRRRERK